MRPATIATTVLVGIALAAMAAPAIQANRLSTASNSSPSSLRRCEKDYNEDELAAIADNGEDGYEPDDCPLLASSVTGPQGHNFCQPGDEDWALFRANPGLIYQIKAESPSNYPIEPHLDLFDNGALVAQNDHYFGNEAEIWFWNDGPSRPLYIRITELHGRADCGNSAYTLALKAFTEIP